jgi:hypothetical protein
VIKIFIQRPIHALITLQPPRWCRRGFLHHSPVFNNKLFRKPAFLRSSA